MEGGEALTRATRGRDKPVMPWGRRRPPKAPPARRLLHGTRPGEAHPETDGRMVGAGGRREGGGVAHRDSFFLC